MKAAKEIIQGLLNSTLDELRKRNECLEALCKIRRDLPDMEKQVHEIMDANGEMIDFLKAQVTAYTSALEAINSYGK